MHPTKVFNIFLLLFLLAITAGCGGSVNGDGGIPYTGNAILSWDIPKVYSDSSPLSAVNIKGYRVYRRAPSGAYDPGIYYFVSAPSTSIYVKNINIPVGQNYIVITTLDISGRESSFSDEIFADLK